jgi:YHS domain-containing protein
MAWDPVCKMEVDETTAQWKSEYMGETYYFCCPGCKNSFDENPGKYLAPDSEQESDSHNH